ncbi:MAG: polysaccharide pyruvyl transferase family protein [Sphingobacteriales bacterium]|nr:MAG: polysaccharide pyruvyl transferase family protein [Sphingobacteriales bacterium]
MIIEIRGIGIENKGAYLMLKAIMQELRERNVNATVIAEPTQAMPPEALKSNGLKKRLKTFKKGVEFSGVVNILPLGIRKSNEWFLVNDVNYVFDASGFFMGDQWTPASIDHKLGRDAAMLKKNGAKIILLPQAFGPFKKQDVKAVSAKVFEHSEIIFARDRVSYKEVQDGFNVNGKLHLAPDFTNLVEVPAYSRDMSNTIAIIPNQKLIEQKVASDANGYMAFLSSLVDHIRSIGFVPVFLIHSGQKDFNLAKKVNESLAQPIEIINEEDPLAIKSIIKSCRGLVTGRFHGLVSALCQGVPVLATSWSHKYEMLLQDYNFPEGLISITTDKNVLAQKLSMFSDAGQYRTSKEKLAEASKVQKKRAKQMWDVVFDKIIKK